MIRRAFLALVLFMMCLTAAPLAVQAYDPFPSLDCTASSKAQQSTVCSTSNADPVGGPNGILVKAANIISFFAGAIAVILLIVGGIRYMTSGGDPAAVKSAKHTVINALIGLAIIVLAQAIITFVVRRL